jgi:hypothetical protein
MRKASVSLPILVGLLLLATFLVGANALLLGRYRSVKQQLQSEITTYNAARFAIPGRTLPILSGRDLLGEELKVDLQASGQVLLLLFDPTCEACDKNWPNWAEILKDPEIRSRSGVLFLSPASFLLKDYVGQHGMKNFHAVLGLDRQILARHQLSATPQTILVRKGMIVQSWGGVLSKAAIREIKTKVLSQEK